MNTLVITGLAIPPALLLGFLFPSRSRTFVLLGLAAAVGLWALILVSVAVSPSTDSGAGESWSLGEYALFGGLSLAVFAVIWGLCVRGGRRLRLRSR
jgi:hypothetical protein